MAIDTLPTRYYEFKKDYLVDQAGQTNEKKGIDTHRRKIENGTLDPDMQARYERGPGLIIYSTVEWRVTKSARESPKRETETGFCTHSA